MKIIMLIITKIIRMIIRIKIIKIKINININIVRRRIRIMRTGPGPGCSNKRPFFKEFQAWNEKSRDS